MGQDTGLPRPGARHHQERAVDVQDRLALRGIEVGEKLLVGRDGHASMLAGSPGRLFGPVRYQRTVSSTVVEKPERRTIRKVYAPAGSGSYDAWQ
jgi:hypothetical protein